MTTTLEPVKETKTKSRKTNIPKGIKHILNPAKLDGDWSLCGLKLDTGSLPKGTDPCLVCVQMKQNSRRWER